MVEYGDPMYDRLEEDKRLSAMNYLDEYLDDDLDEDDEEEEEEEEDDMMYSFTLNGDQREFATEAALVAALDKLTLNEVRKAYRETRELSSYDGNMLAAYLLKKDPDSDYNAAKRNGAVLLMPDGTRCLDTWKFEDLLKDTKLVRLVDKDKADACKRDDPVLLIDPSFSMGYYLYWSEELPDKEVVICCK